jgi:hypothetical protein
MNQTLSRDQVHTAVEEALGSTPFIDVHTHLFMPSLGDLGLWGIDELLTYHYLEAELFRSSRITPETYFALSKREKADVIWRMLFVENTPLSEATRGVISVLSAFGLPTSSPDLQEAREFFAAQTPETHVEHVLNMAGLSDVVMTNDPLDPAEGPRWEAGVDRHPKFHAALRLDGILNRWNQNWATIAAKGYAVDEGLSEEAIAGVRGFLADWIARMKPVYAAVSLPDTFQFPEDSARGRLMEHAVLPTCREFDTPLSLMIGVRYQVNPALRLAGDAVGKADLRSLEHLAQRYPKNRFLVSVLSRENQHELCVYARKFRNVMVFGCWWFLNQPSIVEDITRERIEMLGSTFIPQHSDARVLEQVIYKWRNTRRTLAPVLANTFRLLVEDGRPVTQTDISQEVTRMFRTNLEEWTRVRDGFTNIASAPLA